MTPPTDPTATASADPPADSLDAGLAAGFGRSAATTGPRALALVGQVIAGRYRLLEAIGEGGMGSVWLAQQSEPVKRKVAVKLIKAGMDSKSVMARFEAERQALALMDHPNIAKILDGGLHDNRPYFVMELVKGVPITDYCDAHKLTPRQRLELFAPVCQAIQHAHQKGVIHRDIKPSNVLIALYDDRPVPKVIDFGVAKATGGGLTEHTIDTGFGGVVGTPQYMSPEQATFNNLDIDTRSDVYSLGVLLYELLAGSPPFARKELENRGLLEILRVVREEEPPRPSAKLSTADALPSLSASRGTEPRALTGLLRSELDWIVMKALEKDRARRYETANGFAADVNRYLSGEAVLAHPPSNAYRVKKFVRRHKGQVVAAGLLLFALLAGMAGTTAGLIEAKKQERAAVVAQAAEAERAEGEKLAKLDAEAQKEKALQAAAAERAANTQAQTRLTQVEKGNAVLTSIFEDLDIRRSKEGNKPLEAVLAQRLVTAAGQLEGEAIGDPLVVAGLQYRLGMSLLSLGHPQDAIPLFDKARATRTSVLGADHPDTLLCMVNLGAAYQAAGKSDLALPLHEEAVKILTAKLGPDHPETLTSMNTLASRYWAAGKQDLALPLYLETLKLRRAKLGADHPDTLTSMNNLATSYFTGGKPDLALPLFEETTNLLKAKLGADHPNTLGSMNNLATGYFTVGKLDLALPIWEELLTFKTAKLGADHPDTLLSMSNLGVGYRAAGKLDLALPLFQEAAAGIEKRRFQHEYSERIVSNLSDCHERLGRSDRAEGWRRKWLAVVKDRSGATSQPYADALAPLGLNLLQQQKWSDAEPVLGECLGLRQKQQPDIWSTFNTQSMLGGSLLGQKKYADALPLLLRGYEGLKQREKAIPAAAAPRIPDALDRLIELYTATGKPAEAKRWRAERAKYPTPPELAPPPREAK